MRLAPTPAASRAACSTALPAVSDPSVPTTIRRYVIGELDAVAAQHPLLVGQLAGVLDEEARPAHELVRLLGQHLRGRLGPVLGVRCLLVLFLLLGDDQALLEDHVEAGLDILLVVLVVLLVLLVLGAIRGDVGAALPVLLRLLLLLLDLL